MLVAALLPLAVAGPCDLGVNFQPPGVKNAPYGWTAGGQAALEKPNKDWGKLAKVKLAAFPVPALHILPMNPLLGEVPSCAADCPAAAKPGGGGARRLAETLASAARELLAAAAEGGNGKSIGSGGDGGKDGDKKDGGKKGEDKGEDKGGKGGGKPEAAAPKCEKPTDPGNLLEAGSWMLAWSLDGGKAVEDGPFKGAAKPAVIKLDKLGDLKKGEHYLDIEVTITPESASVSGAGGLPRSPITASRKVYFDLVDPADAMDPIGPPEGPGVPGAPAGADPSDRSASKYYCSLNFNVGGAIKKNVTVERVAEDGPLSPGAFLCARQCNKMGSACAAFGVVAGTNCYLMSSVNTSAGGADSMVTAICMKNLADWMSLGSAHGFAVARDKYYCLPTFDVQGWPAGQGPEAQDGSGNGPGKAPVTDFPENVEPIICAGQCSSVPGCEYFVQTKPAGCWLKTRPFDSDAKFGRTGPDPKVDVSCFRGEESWTRAGGVLDLAVPQLPVSYNGGGVLTASNAGGGGAAAVAANATALTYYCAREYGITGPTLSNSSVGAGDIGTVACAAACDAAGAACAAHVTDANGICTLLKSYKLDTAWPDSNKYSLCFKSVKEWEAFGNPDKSGMYCMKKYDIAGDGVTTRDFVTITSGAGAVEFCKGQCQQVPECEFVVTQLTRCFLKSNIAGGTVGKTGASPITDATCVKGADTWLKFALQVSNQPAGGALAGILPGVVPGPTVLEQRRNASRAAAAAAAAAEAGAGGVGRRGGAAVAAGAAASAGAWLLMGLLAA